jgi:hypothetical protein
MTARIPVAPEMIQWAVERAGRRPEEIPHAAEWLSRDTSPTWRQMESFANAVHVPIGYLFLSEPPVERLPVPDFRTVGGRAAQVSLDLLETVSICPTSPVQAHERKP